MVMTPFDICSASRNYEKSRVNGPVIFSKSSTSNNPVPSVPATVPLLDFS